MPSHNTEFIEPRNMLAGDLQLSCYCSKDSLFQKQSWLFSYLFQALISRHFVVTILYPLTVILTYICDIEGKPEEESIAHQLCKQKTKGELYDSLRE